MDNEWQGVEAGLDMTETHNRASEVAKQLGLDEAGVLALTEAMEDEYRKGVRYGWFQ